MLIAVDGVAGGDVAAAARAMSGLHARSEPAEISPWDASGLFEELHAVDGDEPPVWPRTLLLLYAADLAFRLRWQIRPALNEERSIVAAPYVATAVAFGRSVSIPRRWLAELFRFAPPPDVSIYAAPGTPLLSSPRSTEGFVEFCLRELASGARGSSHSSDRIVSRLTRHFERSTRGCAVVETAF